MSLMNSMCLENSNKEGPMGSILINIRTRSLMDNALWTELDVLCTDLQTGVDTRTLSHEHLLLIL